MAEQKIPDGQLSLKKFMSLKLDAVVDTAENHIDMKAGLATFQGASDASRCVVEAVLTGKVRERQSHKGNVRTLLKHSFRGSYGQIFSIEVYEEELKSKFNEIGNATFAELISYYLVESVFQDPRQLSGKAQKIVDELGDISERIVHQIRTSALRNLHAIPIKFNQDVKIRHRINRDDQLQLVNFDQSTAKALEAVESDEKLSIDAGITRLNINTGNGRLQLKNAYETVAFGFRVEYREVRFEAKKLFSENLNKNNGTNPDKWEYLKITVRPVRLPDGKIVKYIVIGLKDV